MITKDIKSYLSSNYADCLQTISEMSANNQGKSLVDDSRKLYNFDKITEEIYGSNVPESADGIYALSNKIFFVEYKSGFKKKITKENFDKNKMTCPYDPKRFCEEYAKLFFEKQEKEDAVLFDSIRQKALESYMTLMKELVPYSTEEGCNKMLVFCVVVDDYVENMEDILNGLAKKDSNSNTIGRVKQSLSRFLKREGRDYYYDDIKVLSPHEFMKFLNQNVL